MSHFFTIAIIPADCEDPAAEVERLLAPFDENLEGEPHEEECYCVTDNKRDAKLAMLNEAFGGDVASMREQHHALRAALSLKDDEFRKESYEEDDAKLSQAIWKARWDLREKIEAAIELKVGSDRQPDADCEECNGTGKRVSTYNPRSKWDWWSFGGRWNGSIRAAYEGSDGFNFEEQYRQFGENVIPVSDYCSLLENPETRDKVRSFAVITPDGEWHEKGKMGWFAIVSDESDPDDWMDHLISTFDQYRDGYVAVGLDLHI